MGTLVYSMQVSLDGFVADAAGEFASWARPDEQVLAAINDEHSRVSTYLLGRRMYQTMAVWETNPEVIEQSPQSTEFAQIWQKADKVVFSRLSRSSRHIAYAAAHTVRPGRGRADEGDAQGNVTIDGPTAAAHAIRHGLVDRIDALLCPVVVGDGLRFLPDHRLDLDLQHEQRFSYWHGPAAI